MFPGVPLLGLSGTVTKKICDDVLDKLHLRQDQVSIISMLPDRPNIFLNIKHQKSFDYETDLMWLVAGLRHQKEKFPKTVLFAQSVSHVADIYEFIKTELGRDAYASPELDVSNRLLSQFHAHVGKGLHDMILSNFASEQSVLRLLISTVAFGMGVDVPDIRTVIHWGKTSSMLTYWQEVGRCGRDGNPANAFWYPKSVSGKDSAIFSRLKNDRACCIRRIILEHFVIAESDTTYIKSLETPPCNGNCDSCQCARCQCCNHCFDMCPCRQ